MPPTFLGPTYITNSIRASKIRKLSQGMFQSPIFLLYQQGLGYMLQIFHYVTFILKIRPCTFWPVPPPLVLYSAIHLHCKKRYVQSKKLQVPVTQCKSNSVLEKDLMKVKITGNLKSWSSQESILIQLTIIARFY